METVHNYKLLLPGACRINDLRYEHIHAAAIMFQYVQQNI